MKLRQNNEQREIIRNITSSCAGVGDYVLLADEGGASRMLVSKYHTPVDAVIVGVIDELPELENQG